MGNVVDKRAASGNKVPDPIPDDNKLDMRADQSLRRSAGGGRGIADYFSTEARNKPIARGELLGFMEWFCWAERSSKWYRRLWRWLNRTPGPKGRGPGAHFAEAYEVRQLAPTVDAVQRKLEHKQTAAK